MTRTTDRIRLLEECSANAWPAEVSRCLGGWWLRYTHGYSRRVNSVWPHSWWGSESLEERLGSVEAFYRRLRLPPRYQICDACRPDQLDRILEDRGYSMEGLSCVQVASLAQVRRSVQSDRIDAVELSGTPGPDWLSIYAAPDKMLPDEAAVRAGILRRIAPAKAFATLRLEGEPAAVGLGVFERGWLGIYCMATRPEFRRRGAASAVLASLARWGETQGAQDSYLHVLESNTAASSLYARAGFETFYCYHYRQGPPEKC